MKFRPGAESNSLHLTMVAKEARYLGHRPIQEAPKPRVRERDGNLPTAPKIGQLYYTQGQLCISRLVDFNYPTKQEHLRYLCYHRYPRPEYSTITTNIRNSPACIK